MKEGHVGESPPSQLVKAEARMLSLLKRHEIQVLLKAKHTQKEVAEQVGVSERTIRRVSHERSVEHVDDGAERRARKIGRPSVTAPYQGFVEKLLSEEPGLMTLEVLRRARLQGYKGGSSAMYDLVARLRPKGVDFQMRFEGLAGEFSQHDFGQVDVKFLDGSKSRVHFFASRLKWSRWSCVSVVPNQQAETLIRTLAEHFEEFGGMPLLAVFDRPKTVALKWNRAGEVTEWNPTFAYAALEMGFGAEVCWPRQPRQKGSVESLVKWVKGSFFKQRRFHDYDDLLQQLDEWHSEVNEERPSRATGTIPGDRIEEERKRLRPLKVQPEDLALRVPVSVGPTGHVVHETHPYSMPPEAAGIPGTLLLYKDRVRIVAGRYEAEHPRQFAPGKGSTLADHRAARLATVSGKRGKHYLARQDLFEVGPAAEEFLTELVHRKPRGWYADVNRLHELLQEHGEDALHLAFREAVAAKAISVGRISSMLGKPMQNALSFGGSP